MQDRQSLYPGRVLLIPTGEENKYDMFMADEPTNPGTPPTKENLLKDQTAERFGFAAADNPTVNNVLSAIAGMISGETTYRWGKVKITTNSESSNQGDYYNTNGTFYIRYSDTVTYSGETGIFSLSGDVTQIARTPTSSTGLNIVSELRTLLAGKYVQLSPTGSSFGSAFLFTDVTYSSSAVHFTGYSLGTQSGGIIETTTPNAYTEGYVDSEGWIYTQLAPVETSLAKMTIVSYVGTDTYGASNPCSLTFPFAPKFLMLLGRSRDSYGTIYYADATGKQSILDSSAESNHYRVIVNLLTTDYSTSYAIGTGCYMKKSADGKTLYWYDDNASADQLNISGYTYYFLALG